MLGRSWQDEEGRPHHLRLPMTRYHSFGQKVPGFQHLYAHQLLSHVGLRFDSLSINCLNLRISSLSCRDIALSSSVSADHGAILLPGERLGPVLAHKADEQSGKHQLLLFLMLLTWPKGERGSGLGGVLWSRSGVVARCYGEEAVRRMDGMASGSFQFLFLHDGVVTRILCLA